MPGLNIDRVGALDHLEGYQAGRRPMAIVTMPYAHAADCEAAARALAARYGLEAHTPPLPDSGWWFPGWTQLVVFTAPGVTVRWLPMNVDADALARAVAAYAEAERQDRAAREAPGAIRG